MFPKELKEKDLLICPSILSADFAALGEGVAQIESEADVIHFDVMDGHFVPNITIGPDVAAALAKRSELPIDVHLMVSEPEKWIQAFAKAGVKMISIHQEVAIHGQKILTEIRDLGCAAGMVLNPGTSILTLEEYLPYLDYILLMSVNPGFGGQKYIASITAKIKRLKEMIAQSGYDIVIEIDGGVKKDNIKEIYQAGATMLVAGSAVYNGGDPAGAVRELRAAAKA